MFNYNWLQSDGYPAKGVDKHKTRVMTTFACGGGSSMGYKLAGYDVVAANDIDPKMEEVYKFNHNPRQFFICPIRDLLKMGADLPEIDLLDGSPPCSVFSKAGKREKDWQTYKHFREGQTKQILDDLFFQFVDVVEMVKPKYVIAENVKGMLMGKAKWYTQEVVKRITALGYNCQVFLLNAGTMGVPQQRKRVFFIAARRDLNKPKLKMEFNEKPIFWKDIKDSSLDDRLDLTDKDLEYIENNRWENGRLIKVKEKSQRIGSVGFYFMPNNNQVSATITAGGKYINKDLLKQWSNKEFCLASSYPLDYNFLDNKVQYLVGMSVPPVMMAQVAYQVYLQWIK